MSVSSKLTGLLVYLVCCSYGAAFNCLPPKISTVRLELPPPSVSNEVCSSGESSLSLGCATCCRAGGKQFPTSLGDTPQLYSKGVGVVGSGPRSGLLLVRTSTLRMSWGKGAGAPVFLACHSCDEPLPCVMGTGRGKGAPDFVALIWNLASAT